MVADELDRLAVRDLLGREPQGEFDIVARDADGRPVVIRNAPRLTDGTPMPTRYWLVGRREVQAVSRLEAAGGVRRAEAEVDPAAVADAHRRYAAERDAGVDAPAHGGGVGGTRRGVKCLHAHYAWHLAGGDDPVGRWVAAQLAENPHGTTPSEAPPATLTITIATATTTLHGGGRDTTVPLGPATLVATELRDPDPPDAAQLTNALGLVTDHLDDIVRQQPSVVEARDVRLIGEEPWHLVVVERGGVVPEPPATLERHAAEDVFRLLATATRVERLDNPGLEPARVDTVLGTCCIVLAVMRRLQLDRVSVLAAGQGAG